MSSLIDTVSVELLDGAAKRPHLPGRARPLHEESLASWLMRYCAPFELAPVRLFFGNADRTLRQLRWWLHPPPEIIDRIARATGVDPGVLRNMTLGGGARYAALDDVMCRFARSRYHVQPRGNEISRRTAVCTACLKQGAVAYYRRDWTAGWCTLCVRHAVQLIDACPKCRRSIDFAPLTRHVLFRPTHCRHCSCPLEEAPQRKAHTLAVAFQLRLTEARRSGSFTLPDATAIEWAAALTLFSVLLAIAWRDGSLARQRQLIALIGEEVGQRGLSGHPADNYDGLLVLAWIFEDWPGTVRRLAPADFDLSKALPRPAFAPEACAHYQVINRVLGPHLSGAPHRVGQRPVEANSSRPGKRGQQRRRTRRQDDADVDYKRLRRLLISQLARRGELNEDAKDLAHDAIVSRVPMRNIWTYAYAVAYHRHCDEFQKRRRRARLKTTLEVLFGDRQAPDTFQVVSDEEELRRVAAWLDGMTDRQRAAFVSQRLDGESTQRIAFETGASPRATKKTLIAAYRNLRREFPEDYQVSDSSLDSDFDAILVNWEPLSRLRDHSRF